MPPKGTVRCFIVARCCRHFHVHWIFCNHRPLCIWRQVLFVKPGHARFRVYRKVRGPRVCQDGLHDEW